MPAACSWYHKMSGSCSFIIFDVVFLFQSVQCILRKDWLGAIAARSTLMKSLREMSGLSTLEDIRKSVDYFTYANGTDYLTEFVNKETVKRALGANVNITWGQCIDLVDEKMQVGLLLHICSHSLIMRLEGHLVKRLHFWQ